MSGGSLKLIDCIVTGIVPGLFNVNVLDVMLFPMPVLIKLLV
jgi:hypothetical protein